MDQTPSSPTKKLNLDAQRILTSTTIDPRTPMGDQSPTKSPTKSPSKRKTKSPTRKEKAEERKPEEDYVLKPGDYRILVKILEANDLNPTDEKGFRLNLIGNKEGSANPYVSVEILGQIKKTKPKTKTLNPVFNEQFYFEFEDVIKSQLEEASFIFRVMDDNGMVMQDKLIGTFEVDLTSVYMRRNHEYYLVTLLLYDPESKDEMPSGMLRVNIEVLGPDDEPNVHNVISEVNPESVHDEVLKPNWIRPVGHNIEIEVYRAENLPPFDVLPMDLTQPEGVTDAFCVIKYAGVLQFTKVIGCNNPEWNQNIKLACILPNQSKALNVEVWHRNIFSADELIGAFKIDVMEFKDKFIEARWANLYGPPMCATVPSVAEPMKLYGYNIGSHYRGRVLYSIGSYNETNPVTEVTNLTFSFPKNPQPISPQRSYILRIDIYEVQEIPHRDQCVIIVSMGHYLMRTKKSKIENGRCRIYFQFEDLKMLLPVNIAELPDIIFYFADRDEESRRHSFARLKPAAFLNQNDPKLIPIKLKEDKSLDLITDEEFPGLIFAKIALYNKEPPKRIPISYSGTSLESYQLRVMIYIARDLPPAEQEGTSDPFVVVQCAGKTAHTNSKYKTLNPGWFQTVILNIELPPLETSEVPEGISLLVYDSDDHGTECEDNELLGRTWMEIHKKKTCYKVKQSGKEETYMIHYQKPKWKNIIYDATDQKEGKLLVAYALIPRTIAEKIPLDKDLHPESREHLIRVFLIGIRNLNMNEFGFSKPKYLSITFDVSGDKYTYEKTDQFEISNNGITLNLFKAIRIGVANSAVLSPLLDVQLHGSTSKDGKTHLLGYTSINLREAITNFAERKEKLYKEKENEKDNNGMVKATVDDQLTSRPDMFTTETDELLLKEKDQHSHTDISTFKIREETSFEHSRLSEEGIKFGDVNLEIHPTAPKESSKRAVNQGKSGVLMGVLNSLFPKEIIKYDDYDTDPEEDLNVTPVWLKDRDTKKDKLESFIHGSNEIQTFDFKRGRTRGKAKWYETDKMNEQITLASLKMIFLEGDDEETRRKSAEYQILLKKQTCMCRVYILEGVNITRPSNSEDLPDSYIVVKVGNDIRKEVNRILRRNTSRPEFFVRYDFPIELPGTGKLVVELWHQNTLLQDEFLGSTKIDLEARRFNSAWKQYAKKPIEYRPLSNKNEKGTYGRISMWVDLQMPDLPKTPIYDIVRFERIECELRVIVWEAKEFESIHKRTEATDLFARGSLGSNEWLETDTHWRARGKACYNWRWKFQMILPFGRDEYKPSMFRIQLWDKDMVTNNTMVGETEINLNMHRMLDKVYKRRTAVSMRFNSYKVKTKHDTLKEEESNLSPTLQVDTQNQDTPKKEEHSQAVNEEIQKLMALKEEEEKSSKKSQPLNKKIEQLITLKKEEERILKESQTLDEEIKKIITLKKEEEQSLKQSQNLNDDISKLIALKNKESKQTQTLNQKIQRLISVKKEQEKLVIRTKTLNDEIKKMIILKKREDKPNQNKDQEDIVETKKADGTQKKIKYVYEDPKRWYDVYHPKKVDKKGRQISVGKVLLSFELMPKEEANRKKNANGRDKPNEYPMLEEPTGRFSFDILHPFNTLRELLGPRLYRAICLGLCCFIVLIIGILSGYFILTTAVGVAITK